VSNELAMLKHQREMVLDRTGDEYVVPPLALAQANAVSH
jgi:hypothetical protein